MILSAEILSNTLFWVNSARTVFTEALKVFANRKEYDLPSALNLLTSASLKDLHQHLSMNKQLKPIVTPHELIGLKNLERYVMLPHFDVVTKVQLPFVGGQDTISIMVKCRKPR